MVQRLKFLLECRHTGYAGITELNGRMACPVCHISRKLLAVESREWHAHCGQCRYGRWFGQDEDTANRSLAKHCNSSGHTRNHLDYQIRQESKDRITELFGRRVRKYIEEFTLEGKFMTETLVQLTMQAEFVCDDCKTGNCRQCQGHCDCQHKEEAPF